MSKDKFYITTPIYYVNARPHIGHTYTTVACDAIARRKRMLGVDTFFLTGTDEHGQKIERSAMASGKSDQQFVDEVSAEFRGLWDRMGLSYDKFIRTTDPEHIRGVQALIKRLQDRGYIYKGKYSGQYCVYDELYVDVDTPGAPCPECGRPTETVHEENYFFKLSAMEEPLLKLYASDPNFIRPEARRNEVISFVRGGLKDLSISRTTFKWGIPVPDDPAHVIYVWIDALCNYITALGFGSDDTKLYDKFWPADVHMVGKEIVRFHCVFWPAVLMAAGLPLPKSIVAHGWLLFEESKMSKSRGNIVRTETILDVLGADALRYFLMREVVFGQDGSFSFDALVQRFNADLANGLGNLASRTLSMITRYFKGEVPYPSSAATRTAADDAIAKIAAKTIEDFGAAFDQYQFSKALEAAWGLVAAVDKYIVENEPWALAEKQDEQSRARLATVLYTAAEALRIVTALAYPVIPDSTAKIWSQLGLGDIKQFKLAEIKWGQLHLGTKLGKVEGVFPRADKTAIERMQQMEQERQAPAPEVTPETAQPAVAPAPAVEAPVAANNGFTPIAPQITIDDFTKVDLRVAVIKHAEKVKNADKLLRLEVDLGFEQRQIIAGIALAYEPEKLIGRKIVIVANLAPRKLKGLESNGMLLAGSLDGGTPVLAGFHEDVPPGARLK
ncbi:methionyl-tRNA synthetase [Candidatus Koribacter versatilis Ellin345]|uniref:Methionine--tRNA ligase n=1 Tax=Koribacter versatilis (strain Ellin345) TaxID=204669 RepID=Q1IQ19_KORVE|nr:methionine--tRNA ligase [Candidatus Koribacter versatilis]ABF41031.1 methionyl-tRNA synthetase [Candidatus Koribacter versatilis Ellin345]